VGSPSSAEVTLHNSDPTPFVVAGIMAEGVTQGDFSVDVARCRRIEPGADCSAVVSFRPRAAGAQAVKFRIVDQENATSQTLVARGLAVAPSPTPPPPPPATQPFLPPAPVSPPNVAQPTRALPHPPPAPIEKPKLDKPATPDAPSTIEEPTAPEELQPTTSAEPAAPDTTTTASPDSSRRNTLKKWGRIGAVIISAVIAKQADGHSDHSRVQQGDTKPDRRIQVSPTSLTVGSNGGEVTITNMGRDEVIIHPFNLGGQQPAAFQTGRSSSGRLAAGEHCTVLITLKVSDSSGRMYGRSSNSSVSAMLIVNSSAGSATVDLYGPNYKP
jgi:hypothetical protein